MKKLLLSLLGVLLMTVLWVFLDRAPELDVEQIEFTSVPLTDEEKKEVTSLLQELIQTPSIRGSERGVVEVFKKKLDQEGIAYREILMNGDHERPILIAELIPKKIERSGVVLAGHTDVVEANADEWSVPPFSGQVKNQRLFGRGAIDMKGMMAMEFMAFLQLKRKAHDLKRKVMFLALPDEESGSGGAQFLALNYPEVLKGYEYMLNEGGLGTDSVAIPDAKIFNIQYAEKGSLWLVAHAKGKAGHGSSPTARYATKDLLEFLIALQNMDEGLIIAEETEIFFGQLGEAAGGLKGFFLKRAAHPLVRPLVKGSIQENRHLRAMTSNTRSFTDLRTPAGAINVIPADAYAKIDMRLLPGHSPEDYLKKIRPLAKVHGVELRVVEKKEATKSPLDSELFNALAQIATATIPKSFAAPLMSPGLTDSSVFRTLGLKCYGLIPGLFDAKDLDGFHGVDEGIDLEDLELGTRILRDVLITLNK